MKENIDTDEKNDAVSCARQSLILFWKAFELCLVIGCGDSDPPTSDLVIPTLAKTISHVYPTATGIILASYAAAAGGRPVIPQRHRFV